MQAEIDEPTLAGIGFDPRPCPRRDTRPLATGPRQPDPRAGTGANVVAPSTAKYRRRALRSSKSLSGNIRQPVTAATSSGSTSGLANDWPPARSRRLAGIGGRPRSVGAAREANASGARIAREHCINRAVKQRHGCGQTVSSDCRGVTLAARDVVAPLARRAIVNCGP
jgi:hypothetical protein